ncbi:MAG: glycosyltransferase [Acidobacteriota bacterium]
MQLDVIIPTFNRQDLLPRTLKSLLEADLPQELTVHVNVVDNNSKDRTRQIVDEWMNRFDGRLHYLFEPIQGRSAALNKGILSTTGELVGMIDDDEEIHRQWYETVQKAFTHNHIDFIGGPYYPCWGAECPDWLPRKYAGVIGWIDGGSQVCPFNRSYPGILMGGNAVIRRAILTKVGLYSTALGRTDTHLLAGEDEEMYERLLNAGARGLYLPDLIIYHYIPPQRLTKSYFRKWCFWRGVSMGLLHRVHQRQSAIKQLWGIPRYLYGEALRGFKRKLQDALRLKIDSEQGFAGELAAWDLAGYLYGRHFYKPVATNKSTKGLAVISSV